MLRKICNLCSIGLAILLSFSLVLNIWGDNLTTCLRELPLSTVGISFLTENIHWNQGFMDNYYSRWFFLTLTTHQECQNWSGILQEFCYYANAIFLVMLLFYPRNEKLFMVCFSFAEVRKWFQFVFAQSWRLYSSFSWYFQFVEYGCRGH